MPPPQPTLLPASPSPASILPLSPSFAGHGTFAVRSTWLKKGLDAIQAEADATGSIFNRPHAIATLGVGKNMVAAIRYWLLATRMAQEGGKGREMIPTELGQRLFADDGYDPYLEDEATLWLLHWQLAGAGTPLFTWAYAFSLVREGEFARDALAQSILNATHSLPKPPARDTVDRDVGCLIQSYAPERSALSEDGLDCPLRALGLIRAQGKKQFRFQIESKPGLPPEIFAYALATFWMWKRAESRTLSAWDICYGEGSPGLVFKLDENSVLAYLDTLAEVTRGQIRFEDTAQTRQAVLEEGVRGFKPIDFLERFYADAPSPTTRAPQVLASR